MAHLHQFDARDGADESAWLLSDALRVNEVARILVGDPQLYVLLGRRQSHLCQPFGQILHSAFELGVEVFEVRATASGVDDQRVELSGAVNRHVCVTKVGSAFQVTVVREQRAAATLTWGKPHFAARELKQLHGRIVRLRIEDRHNASHEESDSVPPLTYGRRYVSNRHLEPPAQAWELAAGANYSRHADGLRDPCHRTERTQARRVCDQLPQRSFGKPVFRDLASHAFHLSAPRLDDSAVRHP